MNIFDTVYDSGRPLFGEINNRVIVNRPKTGQELKFEVLQIKRRIKNEKIMSAVLAGASVLGGIAFAAINPDMGYEALVGGATGLGVSGLLFGKSIADKHRVEDLLASMNGKSMSEFVNENVGKEDVHERSI